MVGTTDGKVSFRFASMPLHQETSVDPKRLDMIPVSPDGFLGT